ncbi:MAG: hypothetical protein WED05_06185 [Candidatus Atabeyarchaeum deiterrae]
MKKTAKITWSNYVTLAAVDSLVTVSGVLAGITGELSTNKSIVISGALAASFATAVALFFAVYLNAAHESRADYPFPTFPTPGRALAKATGTAVFAGIVGISMVSPFFFLGIADAFLFSVFSFHESSLAINRRLVQRREKNKEAETDSCT